MEEQVKEVQVKEEQVQEKSRSEWWGNITGYIGGYKKEIEIFSFAIIFRCIVYMISVVIMGMMGEYENGITFSDFMEAWKRWDSTSYINIAENTYAGAVEDGKHLFLVFYPLYPWLMRFVNIFISEIRACGILVSTLCYAVGCVYFYKIAKMEFGEKAAENAVLLISVFPFAFFFGSIATESLFFAVTAAFFYYLRRHQWKRVALWGFLACLTRVQGVLLAFAVLVELFYFKKGFMLIKNKKWKQFFKRIIYPGCISATMLGGILLYLGINYIVEGDPFRFMYYQKTHWNHVMTPFWNTWGFLVENVKGGWDSAWGMCMWVPELVLYVLFVVLIIYGIKRIRPMYWIYMVTFFVLSFSVSWLISAGRYTLGALPLFMLEAHWLSKHEKYKTPVIACSAMLMGIYLTGYYMWKQIM